MYLRLRLLSRVSSLFPTLTTNKFLSSFITIKLDSKKRAIYCNFNNWHGVFCLCINSYKCIVPISKNRHLKLTYERTYHPDTTSNFSYIASTRTIRLNALSFLCSRIHSNWMSQPAINFFFTQRHISIYLYGHDPGHCARRKYA